MPLVNIRMAAPAAEAGAESGRRTINALSAIYSREATGTRPASPTNGRLTGFRWLLRCTNAIAFTLSRAVRGFRRAALYKVLAVVSGSAGEETASSAEYVNAVADKYNIEPHQITSNF